MTYPKTEPAMTLGRALFIFLTVIVSAPGAELSLFANGDLSSSSESCEPWKLADPDKKPGAQKPGAKKPGAKLVRDMQVFESAPASLRLEVNESEKDASVTQNFATVPAGDFTVLLKVKAKGAVTVKLIAQQFNASWSQVGWTESEIQPTSQWQTYGLALKLPNDTKNVVFYLRCSWSGKEPGTSSVWFDDLTGQSGTVDLEVPRDLVPPVYEAAADAKRIGRTAPVTQLGAANYRWANALMGGVEYATGLMWNPRHPQALFLRADGGGCWRLDRERNFSWKNLCDATPWSQGDYAGCESLAIDSASPDILYRSAGSGQWGKAHDVMKSNDGGRTWSHTNLKNTEGQDVMADPNGPDKQGGERLLADPNHAGVVWFASRRDGLFRTDDGAATWKSIPFPVRGGDNCGLTFVALDWQHGVQGIATATVYVGVHAGSHAEEHHQGSVYRSADGGATWQKLDDGPTSNGASVLRGRIAVDGSLWTTWVGDHPGVWVWNQHGWRDATPAAGTGKPFCGLNFHPSDPLQILAATTYGENGANHVFYSRDGGTTWTDYVWDKDHPDSSTIDARNYLPWDKEGSWGGNASDVAFDPLDGKHVYHTSFAGPALLEGIGTPTVRAKLIGDGREQFTCARAISPSAGAPLISGIWDLGGMRHEHLDAIPSSLLTLKMGDGSIGNFQDIFDMDQSPNDPDHFAVCGGWQWNMTGDAAYSTDNGRTLIAYPTKPFASAKFGRIAVGTDWKNVLWVPMGLSQPLYWTKDNGASWHPGSGAPIGMVREDGAWTFYKMIAADRMKPGVFYLYDRRDGRVYRSDDGGEHWRHVSVLPTQPADVHWVSHLILATPWKAGDVWASIGELAGNQSAHPGAGLYHSIDGGDHWTQVDGVSWVVTFGFGKGPRQGIASMYLFGQIGGTPVTSRSAADVRLWRSDDNGMSWIQISDASNGLASVAPGITGCFQKFGRVYIPTGCRGVFYGEPVP